MIFIVKYYNILFIGMKKVFLKRFEIGNVEIVFLFGSYLEIIVVF